MDSTDAAETVIRITVPGQPRAWERAGHRILRNGAGKQFVSSYTPNRTRSEQGALKMFAQAAMQGREPLAGPIDLRFAAYFPVPASWSNRKRAKALAGEIRPTGRPDFDNLTKMIDALKHIVWRDDAQVTDAAMWKRYAADPRIVIEVRPIGASV